MLRETGKSFKAQRCVHTGGYVHGVALFMLLKITRSYSVSNSYDMVVKVPAHLYMSVRNIIALLPEIVNINISLLRVCN